MFGRVVLHSIRFMIILVLFQSSIQGQDLTTFMSDIRTNRNPEFPVLQDSSLATQRKALKELSVFVEDSVTKVRFWSYYFIRQIGSKSKFIPVRQQAITVLLTGVRDPDFGNRGEAVKGLQRFYQSDFSSDHIEHVNNLLNEISTTGFFDEEVKLAGFIGNTYTKSILTAMEQGSSIRREKWVYRLALIRLGDGEVAQSLKKQLNEVRLDDDFIYALLPDLIYTHHPAVYSWLLDQVMNSGGDCHSPNPNQPESIPCAYPIMQALAGRIANFPISLDTYGDPMMEDPKLMHNQVVEWYRNHDSYTIIRYRY